MGQIRFRVFDRERISPSALSGIYMCGIEEIPWRSRTFWDHDVLVLERLESESGRVHVPWRRESNQIVFLGTSTLMERAAPYLLEVELARGLLHGIRMQLAQWQSQGLSTPGELQSALSDAGRLFSRAAISQKDIERSGRLGCQSLGAALSLVDELSSVYCTQALQARRRLARNAGPLLAVDLGPETPHPEITDQLSDACNMVAVPTAWRQIEAYEGTRDWHVSDAQIEWATQSGKKVCCGPLLRLDGAGFPDWMYLWTGDFGNLLQFMLDHVRSVVGRYRDRVHLWHVASGINTGTALSLNENERLRAVAEAIQIIQQMDRRTPVVVSFNRPWGEYLAQAEYELAPLHFADALVRADLGLAGVALEIAEGYWPEGSFRRHALAHSRLLDQWSQLGLPLVLLLTAPSESTVDPLARHSQAAVNGGFASGKSPASTQAGWFEELVPLALAKNCVQVIVWNQLHDAIGHELPHGGLFDVNRESKPALKSLQKVKQFIFEQATET